MSKDDLLEGKIVLVVDDEPDVLETLDDLLPMCHVVKASTFQEAKELLETQAFDFAILDIMGVRGYELLECATRKKVIAIMLTAHALSVENTIKSYKRGAASYLPKDEMSDALAAADVCIAVLKPIEMYKTVYPNKVFHYMAAGRPVILAIDGVVREVVETAECGITVPPGNPASMEVAIRAIANDPSKKRIMGKNGRSYIEQHFDRPVVAEKLNKLIQQMVEGDAQ